MFPRTSKILPWIAVIALVPGCVGKLGDLLGNGNQNNDDSNYSDEIFPPPLLEPYTGQSLATYDNTFITYDQLKGRVKQVFNDDWVRAGVDNFAANIGLLGGADFVKSFTEARTATPTFLLALDLMSKDVCEQAAANGTGPFAGLDLTAPITDLPPSQTVSLKVSTAAQVTITGDACDPAAGAADTVLCTQAQVTTVASPFPATGTYKITVNARADGDGVQMDIKFGSTIVHSVEPVAKGSTYVAYTYQGTANAGDMVTIAFPNDGTDMEMPPVDMNLHLSTFTIEGPIGSQTGTANADAAKTNVASIYRKVVWRAATADEQTNGVALVGQVEAISGNLTDAWSGLCEALVRTPDFMFTLPPSYATATGTDKDVLVLVRLAADLANRGPTQAEVDAITSGSTTIDNQIDTFLASPDFQATMLHRFRLRTQSDGTPDGDEPARLWTYLMTTGKSYEDLFTGEYDVGTDFTTQPRADYYGKTGVLTMKGYLEGKQGLPHYNYSARVLTDFMGYVFQVPTAVVQMRLGATPSGTVDPNSICFSCHQLLTPLAYQRRRWQDDGSYVAADASGNPIDQTDDNLVAGYEYAGDGMEAFATQAVKKEKFIHHTIDAEYDMIFKRLMRADDDERVVYKQLWDALTGTGDLRESLKIILKSPNYRGESS